MNRSDAFIASTVLGSLWAFLIGYHLTAGTTAHLLAKNMALINAGFPALPGNGHLEMMASSSPAIAGGVFFLLALGLGYSTISFWWGSICKAVPGHARGVAFAPLLVLPAYALLTGEYATSAALLAIGAGTWLLGFRSGGAPLPGVRAIAAVVLFLAALYPFIPGGVSAFTAVRDSLLFRNPTFMQVNDAYYKWTLYPAEAIKPLGSVTQIAASVDSEAREPFCSDALSMNIYCLGDSAENDGGDNGADLHVSKAPYGRIIIERAGRSFEWKPGNPRANSNEMSRLSAAVDGARILRRGTSIALFYGLGLFLVTLAGAFFTKFTKKPVTTCALALVTGAGLGAMIFHTGADAGAVYSELVDARPSVEQVRQALASSETLRRVYGARAAGAYANQLTEELSAALDDRVINVRYSAALSLGRATSAAGRERVIELLGSDAEWYVKHRGYQSLVSSGWRPEPLRR